MPKTEKVLTEHFYAYVKPVNYGFVKKQADAIGVSYSFYIDAVLDHVRGRKRPLRIDKPVTARELRARERARRAKIREARRKAVAA